MWLNSSWCYWIGSCWIQKKSRSNHCYSLDTAAHLDSRFDCYYYYLDKKKKKYYYIVSACSVLTEKKD
jgi:hypothetical protein